jgi:hypothetical protein
MRENGLLIIYLMNMGAYMANIQHNTQYPIPPIIMGMLYIASPGYIMNAVVGFMSYAD